MNKDTIFKTITSILGAIAFLMIGVAVAVFFLHESSVDKSAKTETEHLLNFLSLAQEAGKSGLYGEADPQELAFSLSQMETSMEQGINTEQDANLYMIYWGAMAVNKCIYLDTPSTNNQQSVAYDSQKITECMKDIILEIKQNTTQLSEQDQEFLLDAALSWNALKAIVDYYYLFMQNNFVEVIEQNNQSNFIQELIN